MAALEFRVLGPLEIRRDGKAVPVTAAKQRKLLSLLLLRANEPVPQHELIDALWEGDPPRTARAAFQNQIHALRRMLGPEALERSPSGYVLGPEPGAIDLDRFRRLAAEARRGPALERAARLREALALWRGPAFLDVPLDASAQAAIARLEEERLTALEDRIEADLELGEHTSLVPELEQLVTRHPLRERFWAQLMLALYRAGRQADALAAYRRAHDSFVDALGIEPGVVLRELQRAVLVQDRALDDPRQTLGSTLERAAAILPRELRERAESILEYGAALIRVGELRQAAATLRAARRLVEAAGDRGLAERGRILISYLTVFAEGGSLVEHLAVAERAARVLEELGYDAGVAFALSHQAHMYRDTGRAEHALGLASRGAELATRVGDLAAAAACRRMAATCAALGPTPVHESLVACEAAEAARAESDPLAVWDVVAWLRAQAGRIAEARPIYERELARLRDRGIVLTLMVGLSRAALAERAAGDLWRAAEHLRTAYALVRAEDVRGELPAVAGELACVLALLGDHAEASRLTDESRGLLARGDVVSEVLWRRAQALVAAHEGRHDDAVRMSDDARARAENTDWLTFRGETLEEAAFVWRLAGDARGASEALREALSVYAQKGNLAGVERATDALGVRPGPDPQRARQQSK